MSQIFTLGAGILTHSSNSSVLRVSGYKDQALIYASTVNSRWDEIKGMDKVVIGGAECELG